jgi:hypothetical protein
LEKEKQLYHRIVYHGAVPQFDLFVSGKAPPAAQSGS